jgi:integrase
VIATLMAQIGESVSRRSFQKGSVYLNAAKTMWLITSLYAKGMAYKTIRNVWGVISMIWAAALAQKYVDVVLPKPKLPRNPRRHPRCFTMDEVAKIIGASEREHRLFFWLLAETGIREGEIAGLRLIDIGDERITVNQSVWHGDDQTPKTDNSVRTLACSFQLVMQLSEQAARQEAKGHKYLFSASTRAPWDLDVYRQRKLKPLLKSLDIQQGGFHAFRHFNVALLDSIRSPLKVIKERLGHLSTGVFTIDIYGGRPEWSGNVEVACNAGLEIEQALENQLNSCLTPVSGLALQSAVSASA